MSDFKASERVDPTFKMSSDVDGALVLEFNTVEDAQSFRRLCEQTFKAIDDAGVASLTRLILPGFFTKTTRERFFIEAIEWLCEEAHARARDKGWYDPPPTFAESIANFHGEISEALDAYAKGFGFDEIRYREGDGKPLGIPIELGDAIIRIADSCRHFGIGLARAILTKHRWNATREWRHGGKVI